MQYVDRYLMYYIRTADKLQRTARWLEDLDEEYGDDEWWVNVWGPDDLAEEGIGRTRDGALQVPQPGPREDLAAWYRHSAAPGSLGPSIIEGHVDTPRGPSVFFRLGEVRPGDLVHVERRDGWQLSYEVTGVRTVRKEVFPTELVYGADTSASALRLITCALFDSEARTHRGNQIVFADLVRARPPTG